MERPTEDGTRRPPYLSDPEDLALHGPRVLGFASATRVARRYSLDVDLVGELLLDHEARGLVQYSDFAGSSGWSVTGRGRVEDERALGTLASLGRALAGLGGELAGRLARFDGYAARYAAALGRVDRGERRWVDSPEVDSCHTVWVQLHEDLLATLGLARGSDT